MKEGIAQNTVIEWLDQTSNIQIRNRPPLRKWEGMEWRAGTSN